MAPYAAGVDPIGRPAAIPAVPLPPPTLRTRLVRRFPQWGFAVVAGAPVATIAGAVAQVRQGWREQEAAIHHEIDQYTVYAARLFGTEIMRAGLEQRMRLLSPVLFASPAPGTPPMPLASFAARVERMLATDALAADTLRGYFRLTLADSAVESSGLADDLAGAAIAGVFGRLPDLDRADEPAMVNLMRGEEPLTVTYARLFDDAGTPVAVYGVVVSRRPNFARNAAQILAATPLLPPSYAGAEWRMDGRAGAAAGDTAGRRSSGAATGLAFAADTVLALRIVDQAGRELYRSPRQFESPHRGEYRFTTRPGGFVVQAALRPDVAGRLTTLPPPRAERLLVLSLLLLALAAGGVGVLQLRRERELVRARTTTSPSRSA